MGTYDLPAEIDFITNITGTKKLTVIGHSMGASQMVTGLSMLPDYFREKVNLFVALGPATRLKYTKSEMINSMARI